MKKLLAFLLSICFCVPFALAGVGCKTTSNNTPKEEQKQEQQAEEPTSAVVSGLYNEEGELVLDWEQIKQQYPLAFVKDGARIKSPAIGSSLLAGLEGYLVIDESVTELGSSVFYGCDGLVGVDIPASVKIIEDRAFNNCNNLQTIIVRGSLESAGNYWVWSNEESCPNLEHVYINMTKANYNKINSTKNGYMNEYFYSETMPNTTGNFWRYAADGSTILPWQILEPAVTIYVHINDSQTQNGVSEINSNFEYKEEMSQDGEKVFAATGVLDANYNLLSATQNSQYTLVSWTDASENEIDATNAKLTNEKEEWHFFAQARDIVYVSDSGTTLSQAFASVVDGGTIKLNSNVALDANVTADKTITLDLNGYSINLNQMCITNTGNLTVVGGPAQNKQAFQIVGGVAIAYANSYDQLTDEQKETAINASEIGDLSLAELVAYNIQYIVFNECCLYGGLGGLGGAFSNTGELTISDVAIASCVALCGGAITNYGEGNVTLNNLKVFGCAAVDPNADGSAGMGGFIYNSSTSATPVKISNTIVFTCTGATFGGAIFNFGTMEIVSSHFNGCSAIYQANAIYNGTQSINAIIKIKDSRFTRCYSATSFDAIVNNNTLTMENCKILTFALD